MKIRPVALALLVLLGLRLAAGPHPCHAAQEPADVESPCHGAGSSNGEPDPERGGTGSDLCRYVCQAPAVAEAPAVSLAVPTSSWTVPVSEGGRPLVHARPIDHVPLV